MKGSRGYNFHHRGKERAHRHEQTKCGHQVPAIVSLNRLRQEDDRFKASLDCVVRACFKEKMENEDVGSKVDFLLPQFLSIS
jgi:hypothetical protein